MSKLMSVPQAAREARCSEKAVRTAIYADLLPAQKVGASWVVDPGDLADWIDGDVDE